MYERSKIFPLPESLPAETVRGFSADLKGLIAFCASKPADEVYCYTTSGRCLLAQFFMACGMTGVIVAPNNYDADGRRYIPLDPAWNAIARGNSPLDGQTFGAALERARSALREGG